MRAQKTGTDVRKEQIAQAAMELISEDGLSSLSIAGIADRVGIVPSAVYRHYTGKDAVHDAVLELLRRRMLENVAAVCAETPDALQRLHMLLKRHMAMLVENPVFPHVVFAYFSYADHAEGWSKLNTTMCAYIHEIEQIVEQGQREGTLRADIPSRTAAIMFIGLVLPAAMLHRISDDGFDPLAHIEAAWPAYMRGLAEDHGTENIHY